MSESVANRDERRRRRDIVRERQLQDEQDRRDRVRERQAVTNETLAFRSAALSDRMSQGRIDRDGEISSVYELGLRRQEERRDGDGHLELLRKEQERIDKELQLREAQERIDELHLRETQQERRSLDIELERSELDLKFVRRERRLLEDDRQRDYREQNAQNATLVDGDDHSDVSDLHTIDEFLHQSTRIDIHRLGEHTPSRKRQDPVQTGYDTMYSVEKEMEKLDQTLRLLREEKQLEEQDQTRFSLAERISHRDQIDNEPAIVYGDNLKETRERKRGSVHTRDPYDRPHEMLLPYSGVQDGRIKAENKQDRMHRDIDYELTRIRQEQDEIKSRSSHLEKESLKLRQLQLEEEIRREMMSDDEKRLRYAIQMKRRAEEDMVKKLETLQKQEEDLNIVRNDNEMLEREAYEMRKQDAELTKRLLILNEKEKLLTDKVILRRGHETKTEFEDMASYSNNPILPEENPTPANRPAVNKNVPVGDHSLFKPGFPKVPDFKGKRFEQWKVEVTSLIESKVYPDYAIAQAVRHSLKDETRQILLTLKPTATTEETVKKLEEVYGNVKTGDRIVHDFYSAVQKVGESCSAWGLRLETLFHQAVEKQEIDEKRRDQKLKERFWRGLTSEKLKIATRVSYESDDAFEVLRKKARIEEEEDGVETKTDTVELKPANVSQQRKSEEQNITLNDVLKRLKSIETDLGNMKTKEENQSYRRRWRSREPSRGRGRGFRPRERIHNDQNQKDTTEKKKETSDDHLNEG